MKKLKLIGLAIGLMLVSFSAGRFFGPQDIEVKEVEKIVYRDSQTTEEDKKTRSTRREVIAPDGTKTIEIIRETDKRSRTDSQTETESERSSESKSSSRPNWTVGVYKNVNNEVYNISLDRRILGGIFLGIHGKSDRTLNDTEFGIGLRFEF